VTDYSYPLLAQGVADVIAEGGSGAVGGHGELHGICSHWEVWMLASAVGPLGALEIASRQGADFLGAEHDLGTIDVGKIADLIVLNSNPLDNIRNTADIMWVMKAGTIYEGNTLDEIWPSVKRFGHFPEFNSDYLRNDTRYIVRQKND
jgi:hypothetical protein